MKFAVHPGYVRSQTDGQLHYVGAGELVKLYRLRPGEWEVWTGTFGALGRNEDDYFHLYPSREGRYGRPEDP